MDTNFTILDNLIIPLVLILIPEPFNDLSRDIGNFSVLDLDEVNPNPQFCVDLIEWDESGPLLSYSSFDASDPLQWTWDASNVLPNDLQ